MPPLGLTDALLATSLLGYALAISVWGQLGLTKQIAWGALRSFLQLAVLGLVLGFVLRQRSPWVVVGVLLVMVLLAADGARRRVARPCPHGRLICFAGIATAVVLVLPLVVLLVLRPDGSAPGVEADWASRWFSPKVVIPLGGLLVGSTMTGTALALDRLLGEARARQGQLEAALALGATPAQASKGTLGEAIRAAMIAPLNHLTIVGLIQIPGVTTGLVLAGQDAAVGVVYQLIVSYAVVSSVSIASTVTARLAMRQLFTPRGQLRAELLEA